MSGRLVGIYTAAAGGKPMDAHGEVRAIAGVGLEGDRYATRTGEFSDREGGGREVTLIAREAIAAANAADVTIREDETRRNLVTEGVDLDALIGKQFAVGDVVQFTRALPSIGVVRHAQGAVVSVAGGAVEVGLMGDGRRVLLRAGEMRSVGYAHVVPPLTALIAGRGDVFVVGGRTFSARHLGGARLHRYVTGPHALSRLLPPHTPGVDRTPELSLARHAAGRGTGRSR